MAVPSAPYVHCRSGEACARRRMMSKLTHLLQGFNVLRNCLHVFEA